MSYMHLRRTVEAAYAPDYKEFVGRLDAFVAQRPDEPTRAVVERFLREVAQPSRCLFSPGQQPYVYAEHRSPVLTPAFRRSAFLVPLGEVHPRAVPTHCLRHWFSRPWRPWLPLFFMPPRPQPPEEGEESPSSS